MAVPCCHKHLHQQLASRGSSGSPVALGPLLRHGIMKSRMVDMLTDAFRAHLLRLLGYKTDAVEFTSAEHTPRNLLLRAVRMKGGHVPDFGLELPNQELHLRRQLLREYDDLKAFWGGVTPHLEVLLEQEIRQMRTYLDK